MDREPMVDYRFAPVAESVFLMGTFSHFSPVASTKRTEKAKACQKEKNSLAVP